MNNPLHYYILAFKNMFDYKNQACRKELNWFLLFMLIFWMILWMLIVIPSLLFIDIAKIIFFNPFVQNVILGVGIFYTLLHIFPLISLVKRRFNCIAQSKAKLLFNIWFVFWLILFILSSASFVIIIFKVNVEMFLFLLIFLIGWLCGLLANGTIIFLMIREKPIMQ